MLMLIRGRPRGLPPYELQAVDSTALAFVPGHERAEFQVLTGHAGGNWLHTVELSDFGEYATGDD